jgi:hypothetical protein
MRPNTGLKESFFFLFEKQNEKFFLILLGNHSKEKD